jgi:hypothetical protein
MSVWSIGSPVGDPDTHILRNLTTGEHLKFTLDDAALITRMLDDEFPECEECFDRACVVCRECDEPGCQECGCDDEPSDTQDDEDDEDES